MSPLYSDYFGNTIGYKHKKMKWKSMKKTLFTIVKRVFLYISGYSPIFFYRIGNLISKPPTDLRSIP